MRRNLYATLAPGGSPKETFGFLHPYDFVTGVSAINIPAGMLLEEVTCKYPATM
jgi:hypothetical protein